MKAIVKTLVGVCSLASIVGSVSLQADVPELAGLDTFIQEGMKIEKTPGLAITVVQGDEVVYSKGFGVRETGKQGLVDSDTLFAIGSNSKYFTATAIGLLVEDGKLDWDEPLTKYLPNLRFSDPYLFTEVTLRDALSHRTGLARADRAWYARPGISRDEVLAMIEHLPREIGLRSGFLYNNFMYVAAGETISAVSDKSWDDVISERIFTPLQMNRSSTSVKALKGMPNVAAPHSIMSGKAVARPYLDIDNVGPAGSINSSVNDMANWCKAQLADGKFGGKQIIPESVIDEVRRPHNLLPLAPKGVSGTHHSAYALGMGRSNYGPYIKYEHSGGIDGMLSNFVLIPEANLCVVTLTNNDSNYGLVKKAGTWAIGHLLGLVEADKDYLTELRESTEKTKKEAEELQKNHAKSADSTIKPSVSLDAFAGTYSNPVYGDLLISYNDGELYFEYGKIFVGRLSNHRGNSFDLINELDVRNAQKVNVSFSIDGNAKVESVLVDFGDSKERFFIQPEKS